MLFADQDEIDAECDWAEGRETSMARIPEMKAAALHRLLAAMHIPLTRMVKALSLGEVKLLREHYALMNAAQRAAWPDVIVQISKTANGRGAAVAADGKLATLIRNAGLLFHPGKGRWVTPSEMLIAQGFSMKDWMRHHGETTLFDVPCELRSRNQVCMQAGNSMHLNQAGIALLYALGAVVPAGLRADQYHSWGRDPACLPLQKQRKKTAEGKQLSQLAQQPQNDDEPACAQLARQLLRRRTSET